MPNEYVFLIFCGFFGAQIYKYAHLPIYQIYRALHLVEVTYDPLVSNL